jgi:GNAT superfamily N-acetyltransferase
MTILHQSVQLTDAESYFLARMTYSHLNPAQRVRLELVEEGGEAKAELVEEVRDSSGDALTIRTPASPKEAIRLHHLFEQAGLSVVFRPEHRFLLILDEQDAVAGGLFYRSVEPGTVHMEKIVVGARHRGKGVGERLMESFLQRMRGLGQSRVTTGFFQPHYFYQFGFRLQRGFAGLVMDMEKIPGD